MSSRQDRNNVSYRPMWWLYGTAFALFVIGLYIITVSLSSSASWSWTKVGVFVIMLIGFPVAIVPGALLALRHPRGAFFRVLVERHYAHPRLVGLVMMWGGLVMVGGSCVALFVLDPLTAPKYLPLVCLLVALAPLLALYLFDRRR